MWNVFSCYFFASLMVDGKLLNLEGNLLFFERIMFLSVVMETEIE